MFNVTDKIGNIISIGKGTSASQEEPSAYKAYEYDDKYQLKKETLNGSTVNAWEYDGLGNILTKTTTVGSTKTGIKHNYGTSPNCAWNNLLTSVQYVSYNGSAETVTKTENIYYDAIGNPYSYREIILGWNGRKLLTYSKNGTTISMTYDADERGYVLI